MNCARTIIFSLLIFTIIGLSPTNGCGFFRRRWTSCRGVEGKSVLRCFDHLGRGINRKCGNTYEIFTNIGNLKGRGNHDQGIEVIINVSKGGGHVIDYWIPGLGSLFADMVIAAHRIVLCVLGKRHKHRGCSRDKGVCHREFGKGYGWRSYDGDYDDIYTVIDYYELKNAHADMERILKKPTKGKGLGGLKGTYKIVGQAISDMSKLFSRGSNAWCHNDVYIVFENVVTVIASMGEAYRRGLGSDVVDSFVYYCGDAMKEYGHEDLSKCGENVKLKLEKCGNSDDFGGAFNGGDDSKGSGSNDDNSGNNDNSDNNNDSDDDSSNNGSQNNESDNNSGNKGGKNNGNKGGKNNGNKGGKNNGNKGGKNNGNNGGENEQDVSSQNTNENTNTQQNQITINNYYVEGEKKEKPSNDEAPKTTTTTTTTTEKPCDCEE